MTIKDKYQAICAIVEQFCNACPACDAANAALGVVIAIAAVINQEIEAKPVVYGHWIYGDFGKLAGTDAPLDYKCSVCSFFVS